MISINVVIIIVIVFSITISVVIIIVIVFSIIISVVIIIVIVFSIIISVVIIIVIFVRNTFRFIDDLFSVNNVDFGNYISAIYPPELQLTDTSTSSAEVCYLDTHIKTGDTTTPFRISIYDKRDDFTFRIVNFPHMDSNIPANPAYGVYISQLVRYARICTSKVDFMNRLRGLSLRLRQQGFLTNLLQRTFTKFFNRHGLIVVKYDATLREMRFAIQA